MARESPPRGASRLLAAVLLAMALQAHAADPDAIARGAYLARAGDCAACHTAEGGKPYAGGRAMQTPFGTIYTTNLTPDAQTGIGTWSEQDLYRAMHSGIRKDGQHLYPAFPYPWFTQVTARDVHDIKAFLETIAPVRQQDKPPELLFRRGVMGAWNKLFFHEGTYVDDPAHDAAWNRGAYLVRGLGHCAGCHTDKNVAGAPKKHRDLQGGPAENMFAPGLVGDVPAGLGNWSHAEIVAYLKNGSNAHTAAAGPMAEVVAESTQYLTDADLAAVASYLKDLPATGTVPRADVSEDSMRRGAALYADNCTGCHLAGGEGMPDVFPALRGSSAVQAAQPQTVIAVVLEGARVPATASRPTGLRMQGFGEKLDDTQVADLVSYIRNAWGNRAGAVSAGDVRRMRDKLGNPGGSREEASGLGQEEAARSKAALGNGAPLLRPETAPPGSR